MDEKSPKSISPLLLFALITALFASGAAYFAHRAVQGVLLSQHVERGARHLQELQMRMRGRADSLLGKIQGAELLMAAVSGVANREGKALSFLLGEESRESFAASVLLDERGGIVDSRRVGNMPSPGDEEKGLWSGARRSFLSFSKRERGAELSKRKLDIQSSKLNGAPVLLVLAPSASIKGFWGIVTSAESLLPFRKGEPAPGESVFLLAEPEQKVLFAKRGEKFLAESIAGTFKRELAPVLGVPVCCDPAAFNAANENKRLMVQSIFHLGMRRFRLVRLTEVSKTGSRLTILAGMTVAGWLASLVLFAFLRSGPGGETTAPRTREARADEEAPGRRLHSDQFAVICRVSESVAAGAHFREVILTVAQEVSRFFSTERHHIALYDETTDRFLEVSTSRLGSAYRRAIMSPDSGLPERITLREKEIVEVPHADEWYGAPEALKSEKVSSVVVFPMVALGKVVGLASFYFDVPREMSNDEVDYCAILFHQAAVAISRAMTAPASRAHTVDSPEEAGGDEA